MDKYVALLALLSVIVSFRSCYSASTSVDANSGTYFAYSPDAIVVTGGIRYPNKQFTLKFTISPLQQHFNLRIDKINVYTSQAITVQLKQYNEYDPKKNVTLLKFSTNQTQNFLRSFSARPYPETQMLELYFPKSSVHDHESKVLCDVQIVITPISTTSCYGDYYFYCESSLNECIPSSLVKDGYQNCYDGSDEKPSQQAKTTTKYPASYDSNGAFFYIMISLFLFFVIGLLICAFASAKSCNGKSSSSHRRPPSNQVTTMISIPTASQNVAVPYSDSSHYNNAECTLPPTYEEALRMQESTIQVLHVQSADK